VTSQNIASNGVGSPMARTTSMIVFEVVSILIVSKFSVNFALLKPINSKFQTF
jgi:hypothetical protein